MYKYLKPRGYNTPRQWRTLWNQWAHQGFLWGFWSYERYAKLSLKLKPGKDGLIYP